MISSSYVQQMAQYNRWQNSQLKMLLGDLSVDELLMSRGAFFGSVLGTANHLLWGDWIWMSRFDKGEAPSGGIPESKALCPDFATWVGLRDQIDDRIDSWSKSVEGENFDGVFTWFSAAKQGDVTKPYAQCVMHFFNHQTHHRGQIHHMLTEMGSAAPVSDLVFLPEES